MRKPTVLVIQVLLGRGKIVPTPAMHLLEHYFCPTIKRWAHSCGYDYTLYTEPIALPQQKYFKDEHAFYNFQRFFRFEKLQGYDYVAYFDADIWAPPATDGRELPLKVGLSAVHRTFIKLGLQYADKSFDIEKLKATPYSQCGALILDLETAHHLSAAMITRVATRPKRTSNHQSLVWEYVSNHLERYYPLDTKWNLTNRKAILQQIRSDKLDRDASFIHCHGWNGQNQEILSYIKSQADIPAPAKALSA